MATMMCAPPKTTRVNFINVVATDFEFEKKSIAVGGVSNGEIRDRSYQQNFAERQIEWLENYLITNRPQYLGK